MRTADPAGGAWLVLVFVLAGWPLYVHPAVDQVSRNPCCAGDVEWPLRSLCPPPAGALVICIVPDPSTTRGEVREICQLIEANHWEDVVVEEPTFRVSRARMIVKRCYPRRLRTVALTGEPLWAWLYQ